MPVTPIREPDWLFVPPLELPLVLRLENGRFGAPRPKALPGPPPCVSGQIIAADDPANPTGADVHFAIQLHEAVDLAANVGDCVYAAYSGRVVEVESNPAGTRGNVTIDHHPRGLGFVTKYNHITDITVAPGEFVQKGTPFAAVSAEPDEPHLHFELWAVIERPTAAELRWPDDNDLVPIDPTRALYAWEVRTLADAELPGSPLAPQAIAIVNLHAVPFFAATFGSDAATVLHVPMYEPMTADERLAIDLLRHAYAENVDVTARSRASAFWGVEVLTAVALN